MDDKELEKNDSDYMEQPNKSSLSGWLLSIIGWITSNVIVLSIGLIANIIYDASWDDLIVIMGYLMGFSLIIWIPLAIITQKIAVKRGQKAAISFIISGFFIYLLVFGGCMLGLK